MTHSLDDAPVEKASRAFLEAVRTIGEVENGVRDKRSYEALEPSERDQLESCVRAALEAAGVAELREENERLTCENRNLRQQLEPYLKGEQTIREARQQMRDELAAERAERSALTNQGKAQG